MAISGNRITAVFDNREQAEQAINGLRQLGISDNQLSVVARHHDTGNMSGTGSVAEATDGDSTGERIGKGALVGGVTGALFGLAALAIPGVGPFVTAGALAEILGVAGGAAASGAIVGGTSGAIAGVFMRAGYDEREAEYYGRAVESGGVLVAVDSIGDPVVADKATALLAHFGGRFANASA